MSLDLDAKPGVLGCRSEYELVAPETDIVIVGKLTADVPETLKAGAADSSARKRELIKAVRAGEHLELSIRARTFRQKDGRPNKNFLRLNPARLGEIAATFAGQPMLLDHNKWSQRSRVGTITASEAEAQGHGWTAFMQTLQVVKPDAVISVLDGTLDRFSIGWAATGAVLCTAHKVDLRSRNACGCWPGDKVALDGVEHIVEYEFQSAEGIETSGVNVPAVSGTRIEDVRAALAAELGIPKSKGQDMDLVAILAGILGCAANAPDVQRAVEVAHRGRLAAEQERDTARTELAEAKKTALAAVAKSLATEVNALIADAYKAGKLRYGRDDEGKPTPSSKEERLRRIAKEDGVKGLRAELDEMEVVIPLGKRELDANDHREHAGGELSQALVDVAAQLGLDPKDLEAEYSRFAEEG